MFSIYLLAGLGNQFFQLFTALAYAIEYKKRLVIPSYKLDIEKRPPYWDTVFKKLKEGNENENAIHSTNELLFTNPPPFLLSFCLHEFTARESLCFESRLSSKYL